MTRQRLWRRLFPSYAAVSLVSIAAVAWYASWQLRGFYFAQTDRELREKALIASRIIRPALEEKDFARIDGACKSLAADTSIRISVIAPDGSVLGDSHHAPEEMENHADRPEVARALRGAPAGSTRYSSSDGRHMMYTALPMGDGGRIAAVIRTSAALSGIQAILFPGVLRLILAAAMAALLATAAGFVVARRLCRPVDAMRRCVENFARGANDFRVPEQSTTELAMLAEAMGRMVEQLNRQFEEIARKYNEQETLMAGMIEGVLAVNLEERITAVNNAAAQLLGIDRARAIGRAVREEARDADLNRFVARSLAESQPVEAEIVLRGAEEKNIRLRGTALKDADGRRIGALVVFHDVTRLNKLENIRREFVANVSHELRTPVTSIAGFASTLLDGALDDPGKARQFVEIISRHAARLNNIIDDLLCLSRIEHDAERRQINFETRDLRELLQSAAQARAACAAEKNIAIRLVCPGPIEAAVNSRLMEHAVLNLVDNAVKYSRPGTSVRVSASAAGGEIGIKVADRGCGIAPEHLSRLFERFYRVDKARSQKAGGTGLGLAIVKHIAAAHLGSVEVKSRPGMGSLFVIRFPQNPHDAGRNF